MPNEPEGVKAPIRVRFTPGFKRNLRRLARKYRHIKSDIEPLIKEIEAGGLPGDQIPRAKDEIYKARVVNSDLQRGKSGGYRVIYSVETPTQRVLVTVYSKTEQADVTMEELRRIIKEVDREV